MPNQESESRRILIVRHPRFRRFFYDGVVNWVAANFPELRAVLRRARSSLASAELVGHRNACRLVARPSPALVRPRPTAGHLTCCSSATSTESPSSIESIA